MPDRLGSDEKPTWVQFSLCISKCPVFTHKRQLDIVLEQEMIANMTHEQANQILRPAVIVWAFFGLIGIPFAVYIDLFGGWRWPPYNAIYDQMIVSVYFALGICAALAIKNPLRHISFLWFVVLSSLTHGLVMLFHASYDPMHLHHLFGDVWILAGGASLAWPLLRLRRADDDGVR
jgi:hypothetical protein